VDEDEEIPQPAKVSLEDHFPSFLLSTLADVPMPWLSRRFKTFDLPKTLPNPERESRWAFLRIAKEGRLGRMWFASMGSRGAVLVLFWSIFCFGSLL